MISKRKWRVQGRREVGTAFTIIEGSGRGAREVGERQKKKEKKKGKGWVGDRLTKKREDDTTRRMVDKAMKP